jgi:hypothetical protein
VIWDRSQDELHSYNPGAGIAEHDPDLVAVATRFGIRVH